MGFGVVSYEQKISVWQPAILELFNTLNVRQLTTELILNNLDIKKTTMYSTIRRLVDLETLSVSKVNGRLAIVEDNPYREFTYTLRVINTSSKNPRHAWDADVEATVTGTAPSNWSESQIREFHKPLLQEEMLGVLGDEGILNIPINRIMINDSTRKGVSGVELKNVTRKKASRNNVEIAFTNNVGVLYRFKGKYQTRLDEF